MVVLVYCENYRKISLNLQQSGGTRDHPSWAVIRLCNKKSEAAGCWGDGSDDTAVNI